MTAKNTAAAATPVLERVMALVQTRVPAENRASVESFVTRYYAGAATEDIGARDAEELYGAALSHWALAAKRKPGTAKVHAYNPSFEQHGWESTHTVVEVVVDDTAFLVDSLRMLFNRRGLTVHLVVHPVMRVLRDAQGKLTRVLAGDAMAEAKEIGEAVMHFEVDRQAERAELEALRAEVESVLADVRVTSQDWQPMRAKLEEVVGALRSSPPPVPAEDLEEACAFLEWLGRDHFTFLGYRTYDLKTGKGAKGGEQLISVANSGLGLLREPSEAMASQSFAALPAEVRARAREPELLIISKGNRKTTVHRQVYPDYIGVKRFDAKGRVIGEHRFIGLYSSAAYNRSTRDIPMLRHKVRAVIDRAGYAPSSHAGKALLNILETYPRDELFQIRAEELHKIAIGILHLQDRQRTRLFVRQDPFTRFFSCLVFIPRERFNTALRRRVAAILEHALGGTSNEFSVQLSDSMHARAHYIISVPVGKPVDYGIPEIEARIVQASRTWRDDFGDELLEHFGEEHGTRLLRRYGDAFRAGYQDLYPPQTAVHDVARIETVLESGEPSMTLYRPPEVTDQLFHFKLFTVGQPVPLSDALPVLENMGLKVLDEAPSAVKLSETEQAWIHDFGLRHQIPDLDLDEVRETFQDSFASVWRGDAESDGFNRLVLGAGLHWREVVILRAYCKYLRQVGLPFSQEYMELATTANPAIARQLVELFHARFDPARQGSTDPEEVSATVETALEGVESLDQDRILRTFLGVIRATLRTNFYQDGADGAFKPYVSFKFDPYKVPDLPQPKPRFEIFVYSPRVEGVHLRGGNVARGGLRWSDRREDFRTEILGLVKAQVVKNTVIVPVGSKGGFVVKRPPAAGGREELLEEGIACYKTFIRGLLDLTDNLVSGEVVAPAQVKRYDADDPYLVVAADKGTATFSDIANGVAAEYGFWLGDAFASGGSAGYDHKGMGITARGGWVAVQRHFRELGIDIQSTDFTVVGIGDMAGDVFGNGMLLSPHIRLVAAFNHMHIFIDPNPDAATSFRERERLFRLPRSVWSDYDTKCLSKGGGVYARSAKSIALSPEARQALGIEQEKLAPNELIRAILKAPVDLLWNGGIGTYVKAASETNAEVGDRANDPLRVNGGELRCRVIGEGGNLGLTQRGRVEFALKGGFVCTDAIDNSGGVDCSDHEVNIKILLNAVVGGGEMTGKQRDRLLADMTDEVAQLVLRNNYLQTQALSLAREAARPMVDVHAHLIRTLEKAGKLNREIEFLPSEDTLIERKAAGQGLTSPELAVLMAYAKIVLKEAVLASALPDDGYLEDELRHYFPAPIQKQFDAEILGHRLRREIINTVVVNDMVNRVGISFAHRLAEELGASEEQVARAYLAAKNIFDMPSLWGAVEALDNRVPAETQSGMLRTARILVERASRWLLRNQPRPLDVATATDYFAAGVGTLAKLLQGEGEADGALLDAGVPEELARRASSLERMSSALDIVAAAQQIGVSVEQVAQVYFAVSSALDLDWLRAQISALPREDRWQTLARTALRDDLYAQLGVLTGSVLASTDEGAGAGERVAEWMERNRTRADAFLALAADLRLAGQADFTMLSVAMRELRAATPPATASAA